MNKEFVVVQKMELLPNEELMDLVDKVCQCVGEFRTKSERKVNLIGIFDDHIVVKDFDTGRCFKMQMERAEDGTVKVDGQMVEVRQTFVEVGKGKDKDTEGGKDHGKDKQEVGVQCSSCDYKGKGEVGGKCPQCGAKLAAMAEEGSEGAKDKKPTEDKEDEKTEKRATPHFTIVPIAKSTESLWKGVLF
jgi:hypothetical protein